MGKRWWRKALGISNAQRQFSRKTGIPLSGRKSYKTGCVVMLGGILTVLTIAGVLLAG